MPLYFTKPNPSRGTVTYKVISFQYPEWLETNKSKHSSEDHARFTKQYQFVGQLCQEYESEKPDDSDEVSKKRFERIMEFMQKVVVILLF